MRHWPERSNFLCKIIAINKAFRKGDQACAVFKALILNYISSPKAQNFRGSKLLQASPLYSTVTARRPIQGNVFPFYVRTYNDIHYNTCSALLAVGLREGHEHSGAAEHEF